MSKEDKTILYRRHLPHWQLPGATIFLTWRLYGSLPREALERLAEERRNLDQQPPRAAETQHDRAIRHHKQMLALTDSLLARSTHQPRWLSDERIAHLITEAFYFHADRLYTLHAFVVMPNHVHVLLTPLPVEPTEKAAFGTCSCAKSPNRSRDIPPEKPTGSWDGPASRSGKTRAMITGFGARRKQSASSLTSKVTPSDLIGSSA